MRRAAARRATGLIGALALALADAVAGCRNQPPLPAAPPGVPVVLCAGDSITAASYPGHLQRLLDVSGHRLQVINGGVNGNTTGEYLSFLRRTQLVARAHPTWVLLQLGTNDVRVDGDATPLAQFRANLEAIIDLVTAHRNPDGSSPRIILATIPPIPAGVPGPFDAGSAARVEAEINPAIREVARRRQLPLADNHALFAARPALLPGIHPSEAGYRALADSWFDVLAPFLVASATPPAGTP